MTNDKGESAVTRDENGMLTVADWAMDSLTEAANKKAL
jgi:hypothetical protein